MIVAQSRGDQEHNPLRIARAGLYPAHNDSKRIGAAVLTEVNLRGDFGHVIGARLPRREARVMGRMPALGEHGGQPADFLEPLLLQRLGEFLEILLELMVEPERGVNPDRSTHSELAGSTPWGRR